MGFQLSTDAFKVYRGTEERIKNERDNPIHNGHIYFAYDSDKLFYDAENVRHEISGGSNVNFIKATSQPEFEGDTGFYVFRRADIDAAKLAEDNIILASDDALYRVMIVDTELNVVKTKQIAGGGGGGGVQTNPITITSIEDPVRRTIDTRDISFKIKVNSLITTDEVCDLMIRINGQEITAYSDIYPLRTELTFTIPHRFYSITEQNEIEIIAEVDEFSKTRKYKFTAFHSEFSINNFNSLTPYGTDNTVASTISLDYTFTGLEDISGHIHAYIDNEELINYADETDNEIKLAGGGAVHGNGTLSINCNHDNYSAVEHGNHLLTISAYAVVNGTEYFVDSVSYDIIWATPDGENKPIIVSSYTNTHEENYNIIDIPYMVYAKNTEVITVRQYINSEELPTSPISYKNSNGYVWQHWTISKYVPNTENTFMLYANVEGKTAVREFTVTIDPSLLKLDAVANDLLLYLSAQDRSNSESALSRQTWEFTDSIYNETYSAQFSNFNWYNNGWQYDTDGNNVLRLNNGATVNIPFNKILQANKLTNGFTIEVEFRCRNATSFAKLLTYEADTVQEVDEYGNPVWEQEIVYEEDGVTPKIKIKMLKDMNGHDTDVPSPVVDALGHKAYTVKTGVDAETGEPIYTTLYLHEDAQGNKTYWTKKNVLYADSQGNAIIPDPADITPQYETEVVTKNKLKDPDGPDNASNWIEVWVTDGAVKKKINYVLDAQGNSTGRVANAVGTFFSNSIGLCVGTQEAFFASRGKTVNVRYADDDKVKISVVADKDSQLLYIYINAVLSGVEPFSSDDSFASGASGLYFNSDYCDLDIYNIRIYNTALNFDGIVQNWIGDAPNLQEKRDRYQKNHITRVRNGFVTLDYNLTKQLSQDMADNYRRQVALGNSTAQKGLPIAVISTYPTFLSNDTKSDLLPYNKAIKQYVDIRFWDPNGDVPSFKCQDFELSVQGTSSQGYPRRNYKAKFKATDSAKNGYANRYPFWWTSWDGDDAKKDIWPVKPDYPSKPSSTATEQEITAYNATVEALDAQSWTDYKNLTGYKQVKKVDIGNGTGEKNFCFKADYMDSSSAHNTPLANYVDFLCNNNSDLTYPVRKWFGTENQWRSTVYGFPMLVFWDHKGQDTDPEFVGRYNFNTDKSALGSFGFTIEEPQTYLHDTDYWTVEEQTNSKGVKEDVVVHKHGTPTYKDACECWELTSNQHGFTGFRRNDFTAWDESTGRLDFYDFWENRYHVTEFDIDDVYDDDDDSTKLNARTRLLDYAKNIIDLSAWIYSTDVHPWDNMPVLADCTATENETQQEVYNRLYAEWFAQTVHHKLTKVERVTDIKYTLGEENVVILLRDYYTKSLDGNTVTAIPASQFVYNPETEQVSVYSDTELTTQLPYNVLWEDEVNAVLDEPVFYKTMDIAPDVVWNEDGTSKTINKVYYWSDNSGAHAVPAEWYYASPINVEYKNENGQTDHLTVGYNTIIRDDHNQPISMSSLYERYDRDTKEYRLSKYHEEFSQHLNFNYCAFYFILTEFFILYDSREKNMMLLTFGPEAEGGNHIWYPIFYDMDTQLGINNSGTVYWDYDVNAQDDGLFSGAGSVLWDNFYVCFLEEIKAFYRKLRNNHFELKECNRFYNTQSADRWTPIMKDVDAFYKYVAPSIDRPGLRYVTKQGDEAVTSAFFYCAQGDRTLNRSAFFRNRFNYKDSEWLGGSYYNQGGKCIQMRYDANWTGTSDPDAFTSQADKEARADLESNATFDIKPYLTQYCSVYYDEIPREGGRFDIQQEPDFDEVRGEATEVTKLKYPHNWQNVKKDGFITIEPLPAIQHQIDSHLALSQQLVYIYGPEYIRDLGDLSLKYLDEFLAQDAVRLNRLKLGNDHPYYKNVGLSSAFKPGTEYIVNGAVNANAKTLLQYIDVSNLSGLDQNFDVSGCLKLNTLKTLGTNYNDITFPVGNVIETLYMPACTKTFTQIQAQKLSQVIRQKRLASEYEQKKLGLEQAPGLYIEKLTDRMNISADTTIFRAYMNDDEAAIATARTNDVNGADYAVNMQIYNIEGGKLGFISYEMLDYIIKQKIKMRFDTAYAAHLADLKLLIRLLDVNWSPYTKIDALTVDDRLYTDHQYFIRNDDLTYSQLDGSVSFEYANKNLGGIYRMTDNRLASNGAGEGEPLIGIPSLDLLTLFIGDYNNANRSLNDGTYIFRDTFEAQDNSVKYLPHIGGEIFLDNDTSISEYTLYEVAQRYNSVLASDDVPMTICARNVTPCPRAKFIEITADGEQVTKQMTRSNNASAIVTLPMNLDRKDYDFRGWATYDAIKTYDAAFLTMDVNEQVVLSNTCGVVETNSPLLEHLAITIDQTNGNPTFENGAQNLLFGANPTTYYAVFTLHKYEVKYILDPVAYAADPFDIDAYENVYVPSNDYIDSYEPTHMPYYKNDESRVGLIHKFVGWATDSVQAEQGREYNRHQRIRKNIILYPIYEVKNAYDADSALDASIFDWVEVNGGITIYGTKRHLGGRVVIPKAINNKPVLSIFGSAINTTTDTYTTSPVSGTNTPGKITGNGFQSNDDIEHIYFQGTTDGTAAVTSFGARAFWRMRRLAHIDFPDSLLSVGADCFNRDSKLAFSDLNNISTVDRYAFQYCNTGNQTGDYLSGEGDYDEFHESTLYIKANVALKAQSFSGSGWQTIQIGDASNPVANHISTTIYSTTPNAYFVESDYPTVLMDPKYGLQQIILYSANELYDAYATGDSLVSAGLKTSHGGPVDIVVNTANAG